MLPHPPRTRLGACLWPAVPTSWPAPALAAVGGHPLQEGTACCRTCRSRAGVVQTCTFPAPGSSAPTCMPHTASWLAAAPTVSARLPAPSGCRAGTWGPGGGWSAEGQRTGTRHCLCSLCRWSCQAVVPACLGLTFVFCPQLALKIVNKYADWALGPSLGPVAGPVEMGGRVPGPVLWWWGCWPALCRVVMPRAEQAPRA